MRKSKAIKKIKLDMQSQVKGVQKQQKILLKQTERKAEALKNLTSQFRSHRYITEKALQLDELKIQQVIESLNKNFLSKPSDDKRIYLIAELRSSPQLTEAPIIQIPLVQAINYKIALVVPGDILAEYEKKYSQYAVLSQNAFSQNTKQFDLVLVDYSLFNKFSNKKKIYPFHPSKVPFDYRKHYNINDHDAYVKHLISSSFTTLKNQQKQSIPIGLINTKTLPNVMSGAIDFVAKLLSLSKVINILMEATLGIQTFSSEGQPFKCLCKHRFTDFIVQEIDLQNNVAQISDKSLWMKQNKQQGDRTLPFADFNLTPEFIEQSTEMFGEEVTQQLKQLVEKVKNTGKCVQFETKVPLPEGKEDRLKVHLLIRQNIPFLESFTKNEFNQKSKKDKKNEKSQESGNSNHILIKMSNINFKKFVSQQTTQNRYGESKKFVKFILMKRNIDSINAGMFISKQLGLSNKHFDIAGTKDKRGVTTQWATLQGMEIGQLMEVQERRYWNNNILLSDYSYQDQGLKLGDLMGNQFIITLRLVGDLANNEDILKNIENLKSQGFINYFGLQRFGTKHKIKTHEIGKEIIKQNWRQVIKLILMSSSMDPQQVDDLFEKDDFIQILQTISPKLRIEKQLIDSLLQNGIHNYLTALQSLPRNARELYLHAYQSYIWNLMASIRLQKYGNKIIVGDLVSGEVEEDLAEDEEDVDIIDQQEKLDKQEEIKYNKLNAILITEQNIQNYNIEQVVLPIYGNKIVLPEESIAYKLLQEIFEIEQITKQHFEDASNNFFIDGNFRYLIQIPKHFEHRLFKYQNKDQDVCDSFGELIIDEGDYQGLLIKFQLKKSSYATMLIRELTKCPSTLEFQQELNEEFK